MNENLPPTEFGCFYFFEWLGRWRQEQIISLVRVLPDTYELSPGTSPVVMFAIPMKVHGHSWGDFSGVLGDILHTKNIVYGCRL